MGSGCGSTCPGLCWHLSAGPSPPGSQLRTRGLLALWPAGDAQGLRAGCPSLHRHRADSSPEPSLKCHPCRTAGPDSPACSNLFYPKRRLVTWSCNLLMSLLIGCLPCALSPDFESGLFSGDL